MLHFNFALVEVRVDDSELSVSNLEYEIKRTTENFLEDYATYFPSPPHGQTGDRLLQYVMDEISRKSLPKVSLMQLLW